MTDEQVQLITEAIDRLTSATERQTDVLAAAVNMSGLTVPEVVQLTHEIRNQFIHHHKVTDHG